MIVENLTPPQLPRPSVNITPAPGPKYVFEFLGSGLNYPPTAIVGADSLQEAYKKLEEAGSMDTTCKFRIIESLIYLSVVFQRHGGK